MPPRHRHKHKGSPSERTSHRGRPHGKGKGGKGRERPTGGLDPLLKRAFRGADHPLSFKEIAVRLDIERDDKRGKARLKDWLEREVELGRIVATHDGGYALPPQLGLVNGTVSVHPDGFGFLIRDDGGPDLFLPPQTLKEVWDGDRVACRPEPERGRMTGRVVRLIEAGRQQIVGMYEQLPGGLGVVTPIDPRVAREIVVPPGTGKVAEEGEIVVVELDRKSSRAHPVGIVAEVLGHEMTPGIETEIVIRDRGLPDEFPEAVLAEAEKIPVRVKKKEYEGRTDLTELPLVTIDGEDARDFDDAVCALPREDGWDLWVAIADVSAYVAEGSALDKEAFKRGNSVYFPHRVLPMLPEKLSNGICSLNPDVERLCMAVRIHVTRDGQLHDDEVTAGVMRSRHRLTYRKVAVWMGETEGESAPEEIHAELGHLLDLYKALRSAREQRGAIDLDLPEPMFLLGDHGRIESVIKRPAWTSNRIIEECMLAANVAVARRLLKGDKGIYRVHEPPKPEKVEALNAFLAPFGAAIDPEHSDEPKAWAAAIENLSKRPEGPFLHVSILRSMSQARYSPEALGHFGLAYRHYTHFTSPIRRYADLVVHRLIRQQLGLPGGSEGNDLERVGIQTSATERVAMEAERQVFDRLKALFMAERIGEEFSGTVGGVTGFGLFVTLDDLFVEGLLHVRAFRDDFYHFDERKQQWVGERHKRVFKLGTAVKVKVASVDTARGRIDFVPLFEEKGMRRGVKRKAKGETDTSTPQAQPHPHGHRGGKGKKKKP